MREPILLVLIKKKQNGNQLQMTYDAVDVNQTWRKSGQTSIQFSSNHINIGVLNSHKYTQRQQSLIKMLANGKWIFILKLQILYVQCNSTDVALQISLFCLSHRGTLFSYLFLFHFIVGVGVVAAVIWMKQWWYEEWGGTVSSALLLTKRKWQRFEEERRKK